MEMIDHKRLTLGRVKDIPKYYNQLITWNIYLPFRALPFIANGKIENLRCAFLTHPKRTDTIRFSEYINSKKNTHCVANMVGFSGYIHYINRQNRFCNINIVLYLIAHAHFNWILIFVSSRGAFHISKQHGPRRIALSGLSWTTSQRFFFFITIWVLSWYSIRISTDVGQYLSINAPVKQIQHLLGLLCVF